MPPDKADRQSLCAEREQFQKQQWQEVAPKEQEASEPGPYGPEYGGPPQYYQQYSPYPQYAPPPQADRGVPWAWLLVGAAAAIVISKVLEFLSPSGGGPQAKIMNFMMKQAMKSAGGGGGVPPGFPDFSKVGSPPNFPGGFPGSGFPSTPSSSAKPPAPIYDMQANAVTEGPEEPGRPTWTAEASRSGAAGTSGPGAKFEEMKAQSRRRRRDQDGRPPRRAFTDVDEEERASTGVAPEALNGAVQADMGTRPLGADGRDGDATIEMLEHFLRDEEMQKLLYQYLPEPMRNKETFDWMLQNPEYRAQLEGMLKQQGAQLNPEVFKRMKSINSEDVNKQLAEHGMTAADVVQKIMGEPELAAAFAKPQVQQAIMELQQDPMAMLKYQNDPDVMLVFEKMSQMFPQMSQQQ